MTKIAAKIKNRGTVLIIALLTLGLLLMLGVYFLSSSLTGTQVMESYSKGSETYYLAEAGIQEAIYKLKHDPDWEKEFETQPTGSDPDCSSWSINPLKRDSEPLDSGSYTVTVKNLGCGKAGLTSEAHLKEGESTSTRRIKATIFRSLGNPLASSTIFTGGSQGDLEIFATDPLNVYKGGIFSNDDIDINFYSKVNVAEKAGAYDEVRVSYSSTLNAQAICSSDQCGSSCTSTYGCPPEKIPMPAVDISSDDDGSYLSLAQQNDCSSIREEGSSCVFTPEEFDRIMWNNYPTLELPEGVVYIDGSLNIKAGTELIVNGVLASSGEISLGESQCWFYPEYPYFRCGESSVEVNRPDATSPSGLLAARSIKTGSWFSFGRVTLDVEGLLYGGDLIKLHSMGGSVKVRGGIITRSLEFSSLWEETNIYLDSDIILDTIQDTNYSPVVNIDHWEEEY